jgi:hypothetical protein
LREKTHFSGATEENFISPSLRENRGGEGGSWGRGGGEYTPSLLLIRDSNFSIPGIPGLKDPGSQIQIRIKEFKYFFNPKDCSQALGIMIRDVHPVYGSRFFSIPDPGSMGQYSTGSRI